MDSTNSNMPENRHIEVAHTKMEAMRIIERLKTDGTPIGQIHLVGKDLSEFDNLKWDADVDMHRAGKALDKFKALFSGEDAVTEGLKGTDIPEEKLQYYKGIVENGGVLIYMDAISEDNPDEFIAPTVIDKELSADYTYLDRRNYY